MHPQSTPSRLQFVRLCECGCGQPTLLAAKTDRRHKIRRGEPARFIAGHHLLVPYGGWVPERPRRPHEGYWLVYRPDHPACQANGYIPEHRLVMEATLGRYLTPDELVHHKDEDRSNNRPDNLEITSRVEHPRLHAHRRWTRDYDQCVGCETTAIPHGGQGRCKRCYARWRYQNSPAWREHLLQAKRQTPLAG